MHSPLTQISRKPPCNSGQTCPQEPQFSPSVSRSTHTPLHTALSGVGQQAPEIHTSPTMSHGQRGSGHEQPAACCAVPTGSAALRPSSEPLPGATSVTHEAAACGRSSERDAKARAR